MKHIVLCADVCLRQTQSCFNYKELVKISYRKRKGKMKRRGGEGEDKVGEKEEEERKKKKREVLGRKFCQ